MGLYRDNSGRVVDVNDEMARAAGFQPYEMGEQLRDDQARGLQQRQDARGAVGKVQATLTGIASGATLGGSDVLIANVFNEGERETLQGDIEANPGYRTGGEVAGMIGSAFVPKGLPGGYLASKSAQVFDAGIKAGGARGVAKALVATGAEGAIQNAGQYIGHAALEDREITAEGMSGALGTGFAFGVGGGAAVMGISKGTIAARRLFTKVMGKGEDAAVNAASTWERTSAELLDAHRTTADAARKTLEDLRTAAGEAEIVAKRAGVAVKEEQAFAQGISNRPRVASEAGVPTNIPASSAEDLVGGLSPKPSFADGKVPIRVVPKAEAPAAMMGADFDSRMGTLIDDVGKSAAAEAAAVAPKSTNKLLNKVEAEVKNSMRGGKYGVSQTVESIEAKAASEAAGFFGPPPFKLPPRSGVEILGKAAVEQEAKLVHALEAFEAAEAKIAPLTSGPYDLTFDASKFGLKGEYHDPVAEVGTRQLRTPKTNSPKAVIAKPSAEVKALDAAHDAALAKADAALDDVSRAAAMKEADAIEEQLVKLHVPDNLVGDVAKAAEDFNAYEKAAADLADAVGETAHPVSREAGQAFQKASDEAVRKTMDRTVRAAEDAETFGPKYMTPKERIAYAKSVKGQADIAHSEARLAETKAKQAYTTAKTGLRDQKALQKEAAKIRAELNPTAPKGKADIAGLAGLNELIDIPGMPKAHDLPVVGPLLSAWLKYRTAKAVLGRFTGRVAATADAKAATLAARTKDKIATSVDRMLGLAETVSTKGRQPITALSTALSRKIYDDGGEDAPKNASAPMLAAVRIREISSYVNTPGAIMEDVRRELRDVTDPDLIAATEKHREAAFRYLLDKAPKEPPPNPLGGKLPWAPSPGDALKFARRLEVVNDPASVYEAVHNQSLTLEAAETLRATYPKLFELAQERLITQTAKVQGNVSFPKKVQMSLLFDTPLDNSLQPENVKIAQSVYSPPPPPPVGATGAPMPVQPPVPSVAGDINTSALYQTEPTRRE